MGHFLKVMEDKLMPIAGRVAQQKHLGAIRDAYIAFMPFIIVGSILLVISSFPNQSYQHFMASIFGASWADIIGIPFNVIFNTMSLFVSFLVAYRLAERYDIDKLSSGILSLSVFFVLTPFSQTSKIGAVIPMQWIGSQGLFVAMLAALASTELFRYFINKNITIKMPASVPPAVQRSFAALIPSLIILILALAIRVLFSITHFQNIHAFVYNVLAIPISHFGTSYWGALLTVFMITILWSVGINSGSMVNGILRPFWMGNQAANLAATHLGHVPPHVVTEQFFDMIWMGGSGSTLSLVIAMLIVARSDHIKKVSQLALGSSIFNINEPVLFGLPVIMNPIMLIPFNLVPLVLVTVQYFAMHIGLVATTTGIYVPWTIPPILDGFLVTGHLSGAVIQLLNLGIGAMIYMPFLQVVDRQYRLAQQKKAMA